MEKEKRISAMHAPSHQVTVEERGVNLASPLGLKIGNLVMGGSTLSKTYSIFVLLCHKVFYVERVVMCEVSIGVI